jgi:DNA-binding response OmpR family regulator
MHEQILIVDDEHDTTELLRYNLQKANYEPLIARNGEEATPRPETAPLFTVSFLEARATAARLIREVA